jgi:hypothetical protein
MEPRTSHLVVQYAANCAPSHPIVCGVLTVALIIVCARTYARARAHTHTHVYMPETTYVHSDMYRFVIDGGMGVLLLDGPAP